MKRDQVCCLTPAGAGAIAVVSLAGPTVWSKVSPYFTPKSKMSLLSTHWQMSLGRLQHEGMGDEIVLSLMGTAESQSVELQLHGGPGIVEWCLQWAEDQGCHRIEWLEWLSQRPLDQMLALATTKKMAGIINDQCHSAFETALSPIHLQMRQPGYDRKPLLAAVEELMSWESLGSHLINSWKIVLAGPPNIGKSSLLNALVGFERAITSPIPGTTRDLVSAILVWEGYPLEFTDTAGLRREGDHLESAGMERTQSAAQQADAVLWFVDLNQTEYILPKDITPTMIVGTKADLPRLALVQPDMIVSARDGKGLPELLTATLKKLVPVEPKPGQAMPVLPAHMAQLRQLHAQLSG